MPQSPILAEVSIETAVDRLVVGPVWKGVDRPYTGGIGLPNSPSGRALAQRLKKAIEAGAVFKPSGVKTDINGKTYVEAHAGVIGRTLNADLRRLGF